MKKMTFAFFVGFFLSVFLYVLVIKNQEKMIEIAKNLPRPLNLD